MATRTSVQDGLASDSATWGGTAPVDGDTVIVAVNTTVTFDEDHSAYVTGWDLTVNGELIPSEIAGNYVLKASANIDGTGTIRLGTDADNTYPSDCSFELRLGAYDIRCSNLKGYSDEPANRYVKLTNAKSSTDTVMDVDTDVSADWSIGDEVAIVDVNYARDVEIHTIAGITSGTITLSSGLSADKVAGAYILLLTRNVKIVGSGNYAINSSFLDCNAFVDFRSGLYVAKTVAGQLGGVVLSGTGFRVLEDQNGLRITGVCIASASTNLTFGRHLVCNNAILAGYNTCIQYSGIAAYNTKWVGCNIALQIANGSLNNCEIVGCGTGMSACQSIELADCLMDTTVESSSLNRTYSPENTLIQSSNHDNVAGALRAWTLGGTVTSVASPVYGSRERSYQMACASGEYSVFFEHDITLSPGQTVLFNTWMRKDTSMAYLPRVQVFIKGKEPILGDSVLSETLMPSDAVDTWATLTTTIANNDDYPRTYTIRFLAKNASGNVYVDFDLQLANGIQALLNTIVNLTASVELSVYSPIATSGKLTLYRGAGYTSADGNPLVFDYTGDHDLSGASSIKFYAPGIDGKACSFAAGSITLELTSEETTGLKKLNDHYEIVATFTEPVLIARGELQVYSLQIA